MTDRDDTPPVGGVLCAGKGTRMAPITDVIPKPLVPFLNAPMLAYSLDHLARAGVSRVGMNLHHLADSVPPVADQLSAVMNIDPVYAREWELLGTAGGVRGIWEALGKPDTTLIIFNGDTVMNLDLGAIVDDHRRSGAAATVVGRVREEGKPGGVWVDGDRQLLGLRDFRHPDAPEKLQEFTFTGVHLLEPQLLETIPLEWGCMVGDIYGPYLEGGGHIHLAVQQNFWAGLDNPALLFEATREVLENPTSFDQVPLPPALGEDLFVFENNGIDDKTLLAGPILVGPHTETAPGVEVGPYSVIDGVTLTEGASVNRSILYGMGRVEGQWQDCVAIAGKVANLPADQPPHDLADGRQASVAYGKQLGTNNGRETKI